jgi:hypothetical protein
VIKYFWLPVILVNFLGIIWALDKRDFLLSCVFMIASALSIYHFERMG